MNRSWRYAAPIILGVALVASSAGTAHAQGLGTLSGTVSTDPAEPDPLFGCSESYCLVSVWAFDAVTDQIMGMAYVQADGAYSISVPFGSYDLEVVDDQQWFYFTPARAENLVIDTAAPIVTQDFYGQVAHVGGTVTFDPAEPDPLLGCTESYCPISVWAFDTASQVMMGMAYVQADGSYRLQVPYGTYDIEIADSMQWFYFTPGRIEAVTVDAQLGAALGQDFYGQVAHIGGTISLDPSGPDLLTGCSDAYCPVSVWAYDATTEVMMGMAYARADGSYRLQVPYGTYDIEAVDAFDEYVFSPARIENLMVDAGSGAVVGQSFYGAWSPLCFDGDGDGYVFCDGICDPGPASCGDCDDFEPAIHPGAAEICDGRDNDCDGGTADGSADPTYGDPCDGPDSDRCAEGNLYCDGVAMTCSDTTDDDLEICDGVDNDCDGTTADGSQDPAVGAPCDGPDNDLCAEGTSSCAGGALACSDTTGDLFDVCDGLDNDCNPSTADGGHDPAIGSPCDGPDSDACVDDVYDACAGGVLVCSAGVDDLEGPGGNSTCTDDVDNDCDGLVDLEDADCADCGDGLCTAGEDCTSCADCASSTPGCGDGICDPSVGEDCVSCTSDCRGQQSGKASNRYCCGDGDGENPVDCADARCVADVWECSATSPVAFCCGDGTCEGDEDSYLCEVDCGPPPCGDQWCDVEGGEDRCNCAADCGAPDASETICDDAWDDDCDGAVDCADSDCAAAAMCLAACGNGTCDGGGEDCASCPEDCAGVQGGKPGNRYCCGNGILEGPESSALCDGNP